MVNVAWVRRTVTQTSTRRDRNAEATRQVIMQAGRELFATQSYAEITGLQICVRAGVTRGALQHHFGSKVGLHQNQRNPRSNREFAYLNSRNFGLTR